MSLLISGPLKGLVNVASAAFTVSSDTAITGTVVVTLSDGGAGGTFNPTSVSLTAGSPTGTFTYTPTSRGAKSISITNDGSLTNPNSATYSSSSTAQGLTVSNLTHTVTPGNSMYVGRPSDAPTWTGASGTWVNLPNSQMSTSGAGWATHLTMNAEAIAASADYSGNYLQAVYAWGSGILHEKGIVYGGNYIAGTFMVVFGGGHGDYAGNEVYAYGPFESNSPIWRRLCDPTNPAPYGHRDENGKPVSRHTYDHLHPLPNRGTYGSMLALGATGIFKVGAGSTGEIDIYDFETNTWSPAPADMVYYGASQSYNQGGYNPVTKKVSLAPANNAQRFYVFDEVTGLTTEIPYSNDKHSPNGKSCVDPVHNWLIQPVFGGGVQVVDLNNIVSNGRPTVVTVNGTGPAYTVGGNTATWCYEWDYANNNRVIAWNARDNILFALYPPSSGAYTDAWNWVQLPVDSSTPNLTIVNGVFGRYRHWKKFGGMILVMTSPVAPISAYKL